MVTVAIHRKKKVFAQPTRSQTNSRKPQPAPAVEEVPAGEFKAKCLALIDDVNRSGRELVITKRGKPAAKLVPFSAPRKREPIIGRLVGIGEIVGDPDDLLKPVFSPEDYDMLK